jgi:hypothetical protein
VAGHFDTSVVGQAAAQKGRQVLHLAGKTFQGRCGPVALHPGKGDKPALALDRSADGGAVGGALDHVAFPVAGDQAGFDLGRSVNRLQGVRDDGTAAPGLALGPPADTTPVLALTQGLIAAFSPPRGSSVDHGVDRLMAHAGLGGTGVHGQQCRGDLFRRPAELDKVMPDEAPERP